MNNVQRIETFQTMKNEIQDMLEIHDNSQWLNHEWCEDYSRYLHNVYDCLVHLIDLEEQ